MSFYRAPIIPAVTSLMKYSVATVPLSNPILRNMSTPSNINSKPSEAEATNFPDTDPVTKAVMDNIMGKLPTNSKSSLKCEICGLEFSAPVVLETHLAGAKHARKVKSLEILKQLQTTGQTFSKDDKGKILRCEVCDISVNSSQQLQTHLTGNKHKQKALRKETTGNTSTSNVNSISTINTAEQNKGAALKIPPGVHKLPESARPKVNKYFCNSCNVSVNSEIQLEQHLTSRKHKDRLINGKGIGKGIGKGKARPAPYWKQRPFYSAVDMKFPCSLNCSFLSKPSSLF